MADSDDYLAQLQALLPPGIAWTRDPDAVLTQLLGSFGDGFARVDARASDLLREADPRTTSELLPEWEEALGLPDPCIGQLEDVDARRSLVLERHTGIGGQSRGFFVEMAASLGYAITIVEQSARRLGRAAMGTSYGLDDWNYVWDVHAPAVTVFSRHFGGSQMGTPYASWGNETLQCELGKSSPGHTQLRFFYGD